MIDRSVFYSRLSVCSTCAFWRGVCTKGHALNNTPGCPLKKFAGVQGADYLPDIPQPAPQLPKAGVGCCGAKGDGELEPLTWAQVWRHLMEALSKWQAAGYPTVASETYIERIRICQDCPQKQYQWFQCRHCRCIVFSKAKLATETCPFGLWPANP